MTYRSNNQTADRPKVRLEPDYIGPIRGQFLILRPLGQISLMDFDQTFKLIIITDLK